MNQALIEISEATSEEDIYKLRRSANTRMDATFEAHFNTVLKLALGETRFTKIDEITTFKDNRKFIHAKISVAPGCEDNLSTVYVSFWDITELKEAEVKLKHYQGHLEELVKERTTELLSANRELRRQIKQRKSAEKKLQEQIEQRADFTRALVHELKTPLTPIRTASELLIYGIKDEPWVSCASRINRGVLNISRRIDELLDLAKSDIGTLKMDYRQVDIQSMLSDIADYMFSEANKKQLSLLVELPPQLPLVRGDPDRLQQVLINLLDNAFKFTPSGGKVTLKAHQENSWLTVEVSDTGLGMTEKVQQRLFQPYHSFENDQEHLSGLGLGLSLCKVIIELHEGRIWARSQKGKGSSLFFTLPLRETQRQ